MLEQETAGGAMAVVAVLLSNKLYVANVGERGGAGRGMG